MKNLWFNIGTRNNHSEYRKSESKCKYYCFLLHIYAIFSGWHISVSVRIFSEVSQLLRASIIQWMQVTLKDVKMPWKNINRKFPKSMDSFYILKVKIEWWQQNIYHYVFCRYIGNGYKRI